MKRPIRISKKPNGKLYIKNKAGGIVNIKTKLPRHIIQKVYVNIYDKNKTKIKRRKKNKTIFRNRPVTDREHDTSYSSTHGVSERSGVHVGSKDKIYLTDIEKERQHADLLTKNRQNTLVSQGIDPNSIPPETQSTKSYTGKPRGRPKGTTKGNFQRPVNFNGDKTQWEKLSIPTQTQIHKNEKKEYDENGMEITDSGDEQGSASAQASQYNSEEDEAVPTGAPRYNFRSQGRKQGAEGYSNKPPSELYPDESLMEDEIKEIIKKNDHVYCPVIAHDEIDKIKVNKGHIPTFFIMNLSNREDPSGGTHWVAVWVDQYDVCYFNSFGIPPDNKFKNLLIEHINKVEHPTLRKFKYNTKITQDKDSSDCGYQCIKFIENMLSGHSFKSATNFTEKDVKELIGRGHM